MKFDDIKRLSNSVREAIDRIPDGEIDHDPDVRSLLAELRRLEGKHSALVAASQEQRNIAAEARRQCREHEKRIALIEHGRADLARRILLGAAEDAEDARQQAEVADLRRRMKLLEAGVTTLEAEAESARPQIGHVADDICDVTGTLERRRMVLKAELALARA